MSALNRKLRALAFSGKARSMAAADLEAFVRDREREAAEKAWDRCVGEMPIDPDWKNFYGDNNPNLPGMIRNLWKSDPSENSVRTALKLAGDLIQELIDLKASPVPPSSTVDDKGVESGDYILGGVYHRVTDEGSIDPVPTVAMSADLWAKFETKYGPAVRVSAVQSSDVDEEALAEVIGGVLAGQEAMHCNRVWEAWGYGTMSEDDFSLVSDDEEAVTEIARAVVAYLRGES